CAAARLRAEPVVDADPVHLTLSRAFIFPDHRNVVLGLAGDHAGVAADARSLIDAHRPLMPGGIVPPAVGGRYRVNREVNLSPGELVGHAFLAQLDFSAEPGDPIRVLAKIGKGAAANEFAVVKFDIVITHSRVLD